MFLALAMIGKGGSHINYCLNLPAGHFLECMPSVEGVSLGVLISAAVALAVILVGSVAMGLFALLRAVARRQ